MLGYSIDRLLSPASLDAGLAAGATTGQRNAIIFARLAELDRLYYAFERALSRESRDSGLAVSLASLAAGIGGTLASGGTSQAFSAGSAAIAGINEAFNEDILVERTIASLTSQMRANRDAVKIRIYENMAAGVDRYPLVAALSDLEQYRQAGTLAGALVGITVSTAALERAVGEQLVEAERSLFEVTRVEVIETPPQPATFVAPSNRERVRRLVEMVEDPARTSDQRIARLLIAPPVRDASFDAQLAAHGSADGRFGNPAVARAALSAAIADMNRSDEALTAWERALGP